MRYKLFKNGEYVNTIICDADFCEKYCEANGYTYEVEVLPDEPTPEPAPDPQADTDAMLIDHEMRLTMLELGI